MFSSYSAALFPFAVQWGQYRRVHQLQEGCWLAHHRRHAIRCCEDRNEHCNGGVPFFEPSPTARQTPCLAHTSLLDEFSDSRRGVSCKVLQGGHWDSPEVPKRIRMGDFGNCASFSHMLILECAHHQRVHESLCIPRRETAVQCPA